MIRSKGFARYDRSFARYALQPPYVQGFWSNARMDEHHRAIALPKPRTLTDHLRAGIVTQR